MTYSFAPSNQPLYVREGDYIQFKFKAPSTWDTTLTVTIQIGTLTQFWSIITVPEDFTPDPYPLEKVDNADLDTMYVYADGNRPSEAIITVSGLTDTTQAGIEVFTNLAVPTGDDPLDWYGMRIDYNGDGTWDTGSAATDYWIVGDGSQVVENGARVQIKGRTKSVESQVTKITLRIGTAFEVWRITTKPIPVNQPIPFPEFEDLDGQPLNTYIYTKEVLPISGLFDPGTITVTNGEFALSSTGNTITDDNGFEVLDGVTWATTGVVNNGDYLQLRTLSSGDGNFPTIVTLEIADAPLGSDWQVTTGNFPSTTPNSFSFPPESNVNLDTLVASEERPVGGITGLGDGISVPVVLISTDSDEVKIKINNQSVGLFPATVSNGDTITLYMKSSGIINDTKEMVIKVGNLELPAWQVRTYSGPDGDPDSLNKPPDKINQIPGTYVTSAPVTIEGINIPVSIDSSNPFSTISIDYDEATVGPRTFDPAVNTSFRIILLTATNLNTPESTVVTVGDGPYNEDNSFTWTVTTYAVVPPPATNLGVWYSKKTDKFDGYPIGTVLPVLKEQVGSYGTLDGDLGSRYPGFIACEGQSVATAQYWALWEVIGNTYGGDGERTEITETINNQQIITVVYSGNFNLPDYRNRRICGTGIVDSARGNSAFVPISNGKTIVEPGAEGGYWYFDKVDPFGPEPLEQIQGTGDSGLDSDFYSLGTVRIAGTESLVESVPFTITGFVSGVVGPLQEVIVATPEHEHDYFAAVVETDDGFPLIAWGNVANGRGMMQTGSGGDSSSFQQLNQDGLDPAGNENNDENIAEGWVEILKKGAFQAGNANFTASLQAYYGDDWDDTRQFVDDYFGNTMTGEPDGENSIDGFDDDPIAKFEIPFYTWWLSDASQVTGTMQGSGGAFACVFDLRPSNFTVDNYLPSGGTTLGHSHKMTLDQVQNFNTDFTGGNFGGSGQGGSYGSGLGNGADSVTVTFTQGDLFMDMTEGQFEYSRSFAAPVPDVSMKPQTQAPILAPFHKAKYIIKAY